MARKRWFQYSLRFLMLAGLLFPLGCSTTQAPNSQVRDSAITAQVKSKLMSDVKPSSLTNISVNTTNGVVTLSGQVENDDIRRRAGLVARDIPGVVQVNNEIQTQAQAHTAEAERSENRTPPTGQ